MVTYVHSVYSVTSDGGDAWLVTDGSWVVRASLRVELVAHDHTFPRPTQVGRGIGSGAVGEEKPGNQSS